MIGTAKGFVPATTATIAVLMAGNSVISRNGPRLAPAVVHRSGHGYAEDGEVEKDPKRVTDLVSFRTPVA